MATVIVTTADDLRLVLREALNELQPPAEDVPEQHFLTRLQFLTAGQVAALCGVSPDTVRLWQRDGQLVARRTGKVEKYHVEDVQAFLLDRSQDRNMSTA